MLLGVDVGGTFTDAVLYDGRSLHSAKTPSTPADQSLGVVAAVEAVLTGAGASPADVDVFAHGMTVGTNALLEERGARTALVATRGFGDLLEVARQNRPSLYRLCEAPPSPLSPRQLRFEVDERTGPNGVESPLAPEAIDELVESIRTAAPESVAVCLLFSYLDPSHERALSERLRASLPDLHVSCSHEVLPQFREYERCSTTVIDAYLSPLLARYLSRLTAAAAERGLPEPLVMRSSGGVTPVAEAASAGAWSVLSGPAGGAVGAGLLARLSGNGNVVGLDMGGTSCDVSVIAEGRVRRTDSREIGGRVIQLPMVDVHTVGAGGGSVGWRDSGGALRVGPRSAGAVPGPACYGRGGEEATVTDANLLLGYLAADSALAGGVSLDEQAARTAVANLGAQLGLDELETAEGIVRVANQEMARALRVMTVERGIDPRGFALLPFGGAGPMHAAALADELGMRGILCPRASGVLSALGLIASERRRDTARTVLLRDAELTKERIAIAVAELRDALAEGLEEAEAEATYALRYRGQAFELPILGELEESGDRGATERTRADLGDQAGAELAPDPALLRERFHAEHERRYGYRDEGAEVELVNIQLALTVPGSEPALSAASGADLARRVRRTRFAGEWLDAEILRGEPPAGLEVSGPCVFELPEATLVVPPAWRAAVDARGSVALSREAG